MHVKKGDTVYIMAGKDKGQTGKVLRALPARDKVLVEGINLKKMHTKSRGAGKKGEIIEKVFPVHISNVKLADDKESSSDKKPTKKADEKKS